MQGFFHILIPTLCSCAQSTNSDCHKTVEAEVAHMRQIRLLHIRYITYLPFYAVIDKSFSDYTFR